MVREDSSVHPNLSPSHCSLPWYPMAAGASITRGVPRKPQGCAASLSVSNVSRVAALMVSLAVMGGCATGRPRVVQKPPLRALTAREFHVPKNRQKYVHVWDARKMPTGSWHWKAHSPDFGTMSCRLAPGARDSQCVPIADIPGSGYL